MIEPTPRTVGRSPLKVSAAGLGCNNLGRAGTATADQEGSTAVVRAALEAGITLFDVADIYGATPGLSEQMLGVALGSQRDEVVIATKFGMDAGDANGPVLGPRGSRRYIRQAVRASLRRLGTDRIDLYQLHEPDPLTPIGETVAALDELVQEGLVGFVGHSNLAAWQLADAEWTARSTGGPGFVSAQVEYSLLNRRVEMEILPAAAHFGLGLLPFFPLANGLLTGKYRRGDAPTGSRLQALKPALLAAAPWDTVEALQSFANEREITMLDLAFGWLLTQPQVSSVIAGATRPDQVAANAAAAARWRPSVDDLAAIDAIVPPPSGVRYGTGPSFPGTN